MDWHRHPSYAKARDRLVASLRGSVFHFRRLKPIVFLCGAAGSARRNSIAQYLRQNRPDLLVFYADHVWAEIAAQTSKNALEMEDQLAELSDLVVIVVESPGTFAELGAFSLSSLLRKKLLPIVDKQFQGEPSFLNTGPIRWVDADSVFGPTIFAPFDVILEAGPELDARCERIPLPRSELIQNIAGSVRHLLFFMCDLVFALAPTTADHVAEIAAEVLGGVTADVHFLLSLAKALGLLRSFELASRTYYCRQLRDLPFQAYQRRKYLDLSAHHASLMSVLLKLPVARPVLDEMARTA